jgi:hypothetical protein
MGSRRKKGQCRPAPPPPQKPAKKIEVVRLIFIALCVGYIFVAREPDPECGKAQARFYVAVEESMRQQSCSGLKQARVELEKIRAHCGKAGASNEARMQRLQDMGICGVRQSFFYFEVPMGEEDDLGWAEEWAAKAVEYVTAL